MNTSRGQFVSKSVAEGAFSSSKELPIGTIVSSTLNFEQFSFATKNNEKSPGSLWISGKSKWAPCERRPISNSEKIGSSAADSVTVDAKFEVAAFEPATCVRVCANINGVQVCYHVNL